MIITASVYGTEKTRLLDEKRKFKLFHQRKGSPLTFHDRVVYGVLSFMDFGASARKIAEFCHLDRHRTVGSSLLKLEQLGLATKKESGVWLPCRPVGEIAQFFVNTEKGNAYTWINVPRSGTITLKQSAVICTFARDQRVKSIKEVARLLGLSRNAVRAAREKGFEPIWFEDGPREQKKKKTESTPKPQKKKEWGYFSTTKKAWRIFYESGWTLDDVIDLYSLADDLIPTDEEWAQSPLCTPLNEHCPPSWQLDNWVELNLPKINADHSENGYGGSSKKLMSENLKQWAKRTFPRSKGLEIYATC